MCGICGVLTLDPHADTRGFGPTVRDMLAAMAHRGPNGGEILARGQAVMGANRLAIRGLGDTHPPLIEDDSGIIVSCNGEIDNHRELRSWLEQRGHVIDRSTDVAVIPALYREQGLAFVESLQGVFALAIWDPRQQWLILARDRAGERHLYYTIAAGVIRYASELAALNANSRHIPQLDADALAGYLGSGFCPAPQSPFVGQYKLRPAELVIIDRNGVTQRRYWQCPLGRTRQVAPRREQFDTVFRNAVFRQSDIDVDYGVLLSGGIDSALITAVARSVRPHTPLTAYCIRFAETSFDEGEPAARIARQLGCAFVPVLVAAQDLPATLSDLIETTGELLADPAWIPLALVTRRAAQDVRVLLSGEGADELFGGYPTYLGAHWATLYAALPEAVRAAFRGIVQRLPVSDRKVAISFLLKRFVQGQELDALARHRLWTASIQPDLLRRLGLELRAMPGQHEALAPLDAVQRHDFEHSLPEALMAKVDRGGMRHALEVRAPFLDQNVIEFAATLPGRARVRGLTTKTFLKHYALRYLPGSVVNRRKRGLSVPLASWLREPLFDWARSRLANSRLEETGIHTDAALRLLAEHQSRVSDHSRALWTIIVLSQWLDWAALRHSDQLDASETASAPCTG
ncbi:MAG: asparagine synthase (glutamine-hydrolyzing) [Metallibacterium sp.]